MSRPPVNVDWTCPVCRGALGPGEKARVCPRGHAFDVAREGYLHLVPGGVRGKLVGDSAEMLAARRRFLEAGHYQPLRALLVERVARRDARVVLEAGCGEGHYVGGLGEALPGVRTLGTDVAKDAIRLAARRYRATSFAVADTSRLLPLPDGSVDVLLDVFAPRNAAEFARVLRPGGQLVVVHPEVEHLHELNQVHTIMRVEPEKARHLDEQMAADFTPDAAEVLHIPMNLQGTALVDMVAMTPNARTLTDEQRQGIAQAGPLTVTARMRVATFTRRL
ncbi:MAG: putative RNA methyltransferase [Myxococcota bacterium]